MLILDGNVESLRARQKATLGYDSGEGYRNALQRIDSTIAVDIVRAADGRTDLPQGMAIGDYHGLAITGSALNIYDGGMAVEHQRAFLETIFAAGIPVFGSCWGLQLAVTVAGGSVHRNPLGREYGYARGISLTDEGRAHALYHGKPLVFRAPTIHLDVVRDLPSGATVLATNSMGLQAASFRCGESEFWGVQYHPEYDPADIAAAGARYGSRLVDEGLFFSVSALDDFVGDLHTLQKEPHNAVIANKYGLDAAVTDVSLRVRELSNWLGAKVLPRFAARA